MSRAGEIKAQPGYGEARKVRLRIFQGGGGGALTTTKTVAATPTTAPTIKPRQNVIAQHHEAKKSGIFVTKWISTPPESSTQDGAGQVSSGRRGCIIPFPSECSSALGGQEGPKPL